ncbi:MAG: DMT family transporter [Pseudomonadota bacterium]
MSIAADPNADNVRGAVFMMASMFFFVVNDALMKSLSGEVPLFQAIFVRGLFATIFVYLLARARGAARLSRLARADRGTAVFRAGAEVGATACFLTALFAMPIADATAILQSTPIALTMIGALVLGERVGWRRWTAVLVGFAGVMLIVRPTGEGVDRAALFALAAVCFICLRDLATKRLTPETPSLIITLITAVAITVLGGLVTLTGEWSPMSGRTVGVLALSSAFLCLGYLFSVMTMRVGEMAFVSPFRYTVLLWALLLGFVAFGETPDALACLGAGLVVAAGLYTFFRERTLR